MKKILPMLLIAAISVMGMQPRSHKNQKNVMYNHSTCHDIQPSNVVIAFDLHEVIFTFSYMKFFNATYNFFSKNPYALTLANPFAGYRALQVFNSTSKTAENVYDKLFENHYPWLAESKTDFINVCNSYILDPQMKKLLEELKAQGYRLAVCSNIGHQAFEYFKHEHPDIFALFEVVVTSHPERAYIRKPAPEFFDHFKKDVEKTIPDPEYCIFIDDKKRNAVAAEQLGIHGIVFKSPLQLRRQLKLLGVNIAD